MGFVTLFIIAVSLSMDAFAVSVCKGLSMHRIRWSHAGIIALFFGAFQAVMPLIGYFFGRFFSELVEPVDHWIAFILLAGIGGKMVWDGIHEDSCKTTQDTAKLNLGELTLLAVATSIDALAIGISFAFLSVNIWAAVYIIGITTFAISLGGVVLGNKVGERFNRTATIAGGVILILIGLKTLLEHLGVIAF